MLNEESRVYLLHLLKTPSEDEIFRVYNPIQYRVPFDPINMNMGTWECDGQDRWVDPRSHDLPVRGFVGILFTVPTRSVFEKGLQP